MYIKTDKLLGLNVSFFLHKGIKQSTSITLCDALNLFKDGSYDIQIQHLQKLLQSGNLDEYSIQKGKLPAITFCGEFEGGHAKNNMVKYNSLIILDIDKLSKDEFIRIKATLSIDDYVFAFWTSPSGNGIKGLISLYYLTKDLAFNDTSSFHTYAFRLIKDYFSDTHRIDLDKSCSDTSRLCFVTSDKNIVVKKQVKQFEIDLSNYTDHLTRDLPLNKKIRSSHKSVMCPDLRFDNKHLNSEGKNDKINKQDILHIIKYLKKKNKSITYCYDNWYRTAFAIANSFSCDLGEKYFLELCRLDGSKHDEIASKNILIYSYDNSRGSISFSTIIHFANEQGYIKSKRDSIEDG